MLKHSTKCVFLQCNDYNYRGIITDKIIITGELVFLNSAMIMMTGVEVFKHLTKVFLQCNDNNTGEKKRNTTLAVKTTPHIK